MLVLIRELTAEDVNIHYGELHYLMEIGAQASFSQDISFDFYDKKLNDMSKYIKDGSAFIAAAFNDSVIVGYLWAYPIQSPTGRKFHIAYVAVHHAFKGSGIGSALVDAAEQEARRRCISEIELSVSFSNKQAISFYSKHNYVTDRLILAKDIRNC